MKYSFPLNIVLFLMIVFLLSACGSGGSPPGGKGPGSKINCFAEAVARSMNGNPAVEALYCNAGANWNDYVKNDSSEISNLSDTACSGAETGGYNSCLHGGELRMVIVENKTQCTGLTASDALGAFNWRCDGSTNPVRMVSTGLKTNKSLSDLVNFNTFAWRLNDVTVSDSGNSLLVTDSTVWWSNPVVANNSGGNLSAPSTIYLVTNGTGAYVLGANKTALVVQPGTILAGPAISDNVITATNLDFLWFEGAIDASADLHGLLLQNVRVSNLRNLRVENANDSGVVLSGVSNTAITGLTTSNNGSHGISLDQASNNNLFTDLISNNNTGEGLYLSTDTANNTFDDTVSTSNTNNGVRLSAASNNFFTGLSSANNGGSGLLLQNGSSLNRFTDLVPAKSIIGDD